MLGTGLTLPLAAWCRSWGFPVAGAGFHRSVLAPAVVLIFSFCK